MPATSLAFLAAQLLLSGVIAYSASKHGSQSAFLAGAFVFALGFALVLVLDTVLGLFVVESLVVLGYYVKVRTGRQSPVSE
ncbi:hypothetical protein [Halosimplex sp. J119]